MMYGLIERTLKEVNLESPHVVFGMIANHFIPRGGR